MNRLFYPKLAIANIKRNAKTYYPYILTCIGTIVMFYNMCFLTIVKDIGQLSDSGTLRTLLLLGTVIVGIFSFIFLTYTNSFLMKRRKKEFGLFNILGMEKRHISRIMFFETLFIGLGSVVLGILLGILLSKLMVLLLFKIISFEVVFGFEIPVLAVIATIVFFCAIFGVNLLYNMFQVRLAKPIELLKGGNVGEREPRGKWLLSLIGVACLASGYYIALSTESPIDALSLFFLAVLFVIIGTYCLFTWGSIVILKMLRANKKYYYHPKHFVSVSSMIYRMKQNAVGLANICIFSTIVIVTLSTTISLYIGVEDVLQSQSSKDIIVHGFLKSKEEAILLDDIIDKEFTKFNTQPKEAIRFQSKEMYLYYNGSKFDRSTSDEDYVTIRLIPLDEYNRMENTSLTLLEEEVLLYSLRGEVPGDVININGIELSIKERLSDFPTTENVTTILNDKYYLVVNRIDTIQRVYDSVYGPGEMDRLEYYYGFDLMNDPNTQIEIAESIEEAMADVKISGYVSSVEILRVSFYSIYGGLFFLGIFLGLLFIMATVLIIYYKQIAEGYDDKERFEIMQKVGMSHMEVKKSIHSQVLSVFFLPLITAIVHIAFAFQVITKLLLLFGLSNVGLYALCTGITILVFTIFYILIYAVTARIYYKIVSSKSESK